MAGAGKVKIEDIDLVLKDAQICYAQLNILHLRVNEPDVDENIRAEIESKCAMIFRNMMFNLYSVLDQIYYYLHCYFQHDGDVSVSADVFKIKQPMNEKLKWSEDDTLDEPSECQEKRNEWITKQCKDIFGDNCPEHVRYLQENLLQLQAIRKVDQSGYEVTGPKAGPTLSRACDVRHDAAGKVSEFNPSSVKFEDLKSVENMDDWKDTTIFNLLHFFRNFTAHRSLIACPIKDGYLNCETREFRPGDQNSPLNVPWIFIAKGFWISVPELSHIRQKDVRPYVATKFYQHPLLKVCDRFLSFVKIQRDNLCRVVGGKYPYELGWDFEGVITFRKNGNTVGRCEWERANLWPLGNY